jgi:histidine ammonia-lyase
MGANAARHALEILENVRLVLAVELLTAAQAIDLRPEGPSRLGRGTAAAHRVVRQTVSFLEHDRPLSPDIETLAELISSEQLIQAVESVR